MAATFSVDSIHINVAAGDSAIHLLIQTSGSKPDGTTVRPDYPWVVRAILIDGGDHNHSTPLNVLKVINQLPLNYDFNAKRTVFDSVILTHWDKDHYRGLVKLLNLDVEATVQRAKQAGRSITAEDVQISFFRYDGAGRDTPLTVFYCPNWDHEGSSPKDNVNYLRGHSSDFGKTTTGNMAYLTLYLRNGSNTGSIKTLDNVARLDYTGLLGMEFFSGQKLSSTDVLQCNSPTLLVQKHNFQQGIPGMYCVATGATFLHQTAGLPGVVNQHDSMTNAYSISIMILWPITKTGELSKMSHYFSGDAEFETEEGVVDWTGATSANGYNVTHLKASHHGSATSFPTKMFYCFVPRNVIVSAGASYGHPRWELVAYFIAYKAWVTSHNQPTPWMYPTCYPYWFARNASGKFILPRITPDQWDQTTSQFIQDFDTLWKQSEGRGNIYENPRWQYVKQGFTKQDDKLQWIFSFCYVFWNVISQIKGQYYPQGSHTKNAVYFGSTQTALTTRQKIKFMRVRSSYNDNQTFALPIEDNDAVATASPGSSTTTSLDKWQPFDLLTWNVKLGPAAAEGSILIPDQETFDDEDSDVEEGDPDTMQTESVTSRAGRLSLNSFPAPVRARASIPSNGDYYCSERTFVAGIHACDLSGDLDIFVSALHFGWLGVDAFPTNGGEALVLVDDEVNLWLAVNFGITQLGITGDNTSISTMQCILPFASTNLTLATENVPWAFNLPDATQPTISTTGPLAPILFSYDMLILALGELPTAVENIQLSDVCAFLNVEVPNFAGQSLELPLKLTDTMKPGYRNALWFMPTNRYQTLLRLALDVTEVDNLNSLIFSKVGLVVHGAQVILRKSGSFGNMNGTPALESTSEIMFTTQILIDGEDPAEAAAFTAAVIYSFADGNTQIIVQCNADRNQWSRYLAWVETKLNIPTGIADLLPVQKSWFPLPRRISLTVDTNIAIQTLSIDFEVEAAFGQDTAFLFTFGYTPNRKELSAALWSGPSTTSIFSPPMSASMMPDYEDYLVFEPTNKFAQSTINLVDLLDSGTGLGAVLPNGILPAVTGLSLDLVLETPPSGKSQTHVEFYAMMTGSDPGKATVPTIALNSMGLDLQYNFGTSDFSLALDFEVQLNSRDSANYVPVILEGSIYYYNNGIGGTGGSPTWQLEASVNGLMVGHLLSFFETQSQNGVMDLIEHIELQQIDVLYDYDPSGAGNHFLIDGILLFGSMQLTLTFEHWPNDQWDFTADLIAPDVNTTINSVLGYISSDIQLPDFIGNINLLSKDSGLHLAVWKTDLTINAKAVLYTVLQIDIKLGDFDVQFMQYTTAGWAGPKRIFRALVSGLSDDIPHIPVIDQLKQPYDELFFLYVQDSSGQPNEGILRQELNLLNGAPNQPITPAFLWRDIVRPEKQTPTDTIYAVGLHFDVVAVEDGGPIVVLDHLFSEDSSTTSSSEVSRVRDAPSDTGSGSDVSMGAMKKTSGPLTISNIGIQYKNGHLLILLDATFTLGPIALELLGFGLDFDLSQPGANLRNLPIPTPTLSDLGFGFNQPPLEIDGLFQRVQTPDGSDLFQGGVVVTFEPYLFMAAGCYGIMVAGNDYYKTVALYALLEGPLVELEFAEIDGICGGFGYNSNVKYPTIDTVSSFPFIAKTGLGPTPLDTINNLLNPKTGCINAQDGSIWLAAGLNVYAFKLLNVDAVVMIEFSAADIKLGIFADVIGVFPPDPESFKMIYVELGLMATVDFGAGTMLIQGQLAPTSYVLNPACHLSGGFALAYWFGNSQYAGDWVFTIGGYHPQFQAPSYYPSVPRLAISWSIDSSLNITGESYFALTPKVCMGGGQLKASLSLDPLYAYFEAFADFLIQFQPFYFIGDMGIDVGVSFTLDLWIVTIHINVDIGAELYIQGPPVHGHVHVDFWVFGFDIYFGDEQPAQPAVDLLGFWALLQQQSQTTQALAGSGATNVLLPTGTLTDPQDPINPTSGDDIRDHAHQISCAGGLITSASQSLTTPEGQPWNVRAGPFAFTVASPFVIGHVDIEQGASVDGSGQPIYSRPMQLPGTLASTMTIKVTRMEEGQEFTDDGFRIQKPEFNRVAGAMWAQYTLAEDPLATGNFNNPMTSQTDLSSTTILHLTSITAIAPKPYYPNKITEPLTKFNAVDASSDDVFPSPPAVAPTDAASTNWEPVIPTASTEWTDVPQLWAAPDWSADAQKSTVDIWTQTMGDVWKNGLSTNHGGALVSEGPGVLLQGFEAYYMAAPLMTVMTAA